MSFSRTPNVVIAQSDNATTKGASAHHHGQWRFRGSCWTWNVSPYNTGLVRLRDVGSWLKEDNRLYVGRRDCTKLVNGMSWQVQAVTKALSGLEVPVFSAVCFTDAEWKLFAKPFTLKGVYVSGPVALARKISETSALGVEQVREIAVRLSKALPAK